MSILKYFLLINIIFFINSIPINISNKRNIKLINSSYLVMTFMKDIGYQNFFSNEYIKECFINYNYNNYNTCYIQRNDIIGFTFKKEFKNLDSFLSNNKSRQMEYLLSVDLSELIPLIKNVTSMNYMFKGCKNLKYINFGNFDASKVTSMISIFEGCNSLISINLSNFDTSNVLDMSGLFNNLISLKLLDISNFNMKKVIKFENIFNNLTNLRYINIYNFKNEKNKIIYNTFKNKENLIICQNEKIIINPNAIYKCCSAEKDDCNILSNKNKILIKQKYNLKNQKKINIHRLSNEIPEEKTELLALGFNYYKKTNISLIMDFYLITLNNNVNFKLLNGSVNANFIDNNSTETEYVTCNLVNNTKIHNKYKISVLCPTSLTIFNDFYNYKSEPSFEVVGVSSIYEITPEYPFIVEALESFEQRIYILEVRLSNENQIKDNYFFISGIINGFNPNNIKNNINLIVSDYNKENNVNSLNCSLNNINKNNYALHCENDNYSIKDLQNSVSFINDNNDILLINISENNCNSIDFIEGKCIPPINSDTNSTMSDFIYNILDDIEEGKFNNIFNKAISENITYNATENNITYVISTVSSQYNTNYSTVGLEECESLLKNKNLLDKNETSILFKLEYNIKNAKIPIIEYQLYLKNGTKMNISYCYNISQKITIPVDIDEKQEFIHNPKSDFYTDKCYPYTTEYNTDLTMYNRKNNYNIKYYSLCEKNCEYKKYDHENKRVECDCTTKTKFPEIANKNKKELNLKELLHQFADVIKHWNLFLFKCYKVVFSSEGLKKNSGSYINIIIFSGIIFCTIFFGVKGYYLYKKRINNIINKKLKNNNIHIETDLGLGDNINVKGNNLNKINNINSSETNINKDSLETYNDFEMNELDYESALKNEKRSFLEMYVSYIKIKQPIYYTFFLENDYNSYIIKICLFLFSFILEYSINALFFNDSTMNKIYIDRGKYNFIYQLPQIIYSFLISFTITKILSYFILSEDNISKIAEIKNEETIDKINKLFKKSIRKLIIFFIFILLLNLVFWYYLSSFCGVYKNSQSALIKDTIISFVISLFIYPYIFCLILSIIRYRSLRSETKYRKYLYNFSNKVINPIFA